MRRDCAFRLRISYQLPRPLDVEELDEAIEGEVEVEEFSRLIPSAKNLLRFRISDVSVATAVEGGTELVVSYGKLGAEALARDRPDFERLLSEHYGSLRMD